MCQSGIKSVETSGPKEPAIIDCLCSPFDDFDAVLVFLRILGNYFRFIFHLRATSFSFESNCSPLSHFKPNYSFSIPVVISISSCWNNNNFMYQGFFVKVNFACYKNSCLWIWNTRVVLEIEESYNEIRLRTAWDSRGMVFWEIGCQIVCCEQTLFIFVWNGKQRKMTEHLSQSEALRVKFIRLQLKRVAETPV